MSQYNLPVIWVTRFCDVQLCGFLCPWIDDILSKRMDDARPFGVLVSEPLNIPTQVNLSAVHASIALPHVRCHLIQAKKEPYSRPADEADQVYQGEPPIFPHDNQHVALARQTCSSQPGDHSDNMSVHSGHFLILFYSTVRLFC